MTSMTKTVFNAGLASAVLLTAVSAQAVTIGKTGDTTITMGGYVKLDAMFTDWGDGTVSGSSFARDFYVPSVTPVGGTSENTVFDMHARQTRINFGTETKMGDKTLKSFIEVDFMVTEKDGSSNTDERISNSYNPRLRHAFLSYDNWLFGQTWSTFMNVGALPESVDFIGNTDGTIFVRQAQIRYTRGPWQFAVENPETTVTTGGGRVIADDNEWPDFIARYNLTNKDLSLVLAGMLRQLTYNNGGAIDDTEMGWGISVTGKYVFGNKDDIRFGLNTGGGLGRYVALNAANDAVVDNNNQLEAIDSLAWFGAWRHNWNQKYRSNFIYSRFDADNNTSLANVGGGTLKNTSSARANLMFDWAKNLTLGGEIAFAKRENESGADGDMTRLQFMAMYKF
jgi:hypothetical protein